MPASWQGSMSGRADLCSAAPEASSAPPGAPEALTVHEFLSRLVSNPRDRSAFESDSRGSLEQAGLGEMTTTDVLHATSLVLDYAPAEVVDEYTRSVHASVERFAAGHQYIAVNHPTPLNLNHQEGLELNMLNTDQILSATGDIDETLLSGGGNGQEGDQKQVDNSQDNSQQSSESNTDVNVQDLVGDVNAAGITGGVTGLANSGDVNAGNVAGNGVTDVVGGVEGTAGDVTSGVMPEVGDVTSALPIEDTLSPQGGDVMAPVSNAVDGTVGQVQDTAGDVTGGLGLGLE